VRDDRDVAQVIAGRQRACGHQKALPERGVEARVQGRQAILGQESLTSIANDLLSGSSPSLNALRGVLIPNAGRLRRSHRTWSPAQLLRPSAPTAA
jgi:hypothetical protein